MAGGGEMKEIDDWVVIEQPCGCCGVKNKVDGHVWGYPMAKEPARAVKDFANWLDKEKT